MALSFCKLAALANNARRAGRLLSGIAEGLIRNGLENLPILAVETEGADCLAKSLAAHKIISMPAITSIATSLGASSVAHNAWKISQERDVRSMVVSDREALDASERFLDDHRILVEPACGASLSIVYSEPRRKFLSNFQAPLVVVCGGATATQQKFAEWQRTFA